MPIQYYNMTGKVITNDFAIEQFLLSVNRVLSKDHDYEGESHDFWEIVYVDDGELEVTEDGNVYNLGEGDIIFHAPMEFHRLRSYGGTAPNVTNLSFGAMGEYPPELLSGVFHLDESGRKEFLQISRCVREWMESQEEGSFYGKEIASRLISFMFRLSRTYLPQPKKISAERVHTYKRLVEIMNEEVYSNISISELAERMFMSVSYVKVLFSRYAGVSPKAYYTNLRLNEAKKLLAEGKNVYEIAERMNFSTPGYFSVFFKKHTGMTPKYYKNRMK